MICNKNWYRCKEPTRLVSIKNSQNAILAQAQMLEREDIMLRLIGPGHDMVANDISHHKSCINKSKAIRTPLFNDKCDFLIKSLPDQYRTIIQE